MGTVLAEGVGDVEIDLIDGVYLVRCTRCGGEEGEKFPTLEAATAHARAEWNGRLMTRLARESCRLPMASEETTERLRKALDGLTNLGEVRDGG